MTWSRPKKRCMNRRSHTRLSNGERRSRTRHGWPRTSAAPARAQGIPSARIALALVDLEVHLAGMGVLEWPSALGVALGPDVVDRLGHAVIGRHAGVAQVFEPAQDVVEVVGWEGEAGPVAVDDLPGREPTE